MGKINVMGKTREFYPIITIHGTLMLAWDSADVLTCSDYEFFDIMIFFWKGVIGGL